MHSTRGGFLGRDDPMKLLSSRKPYPQAGQVPTLNGQGQGPLSSGPHPPGLSFITAPPPCSPASMGFPGLGADSAVKGQVSAGSSWAGVGALLPLAVPRSLRRALLGAAHSRGTALNRMNQRPNSYGLKRIHTQPHPLGWQARPGPGDCADPTSHLT